MAEKLGITIIPTYDTRTIAVADITNYSTNPPEVINPTIEIKIPGVEVVVVKPFKVGEINVFDSTDLGLTTAGNETDIPDGMYTIKYTISPPLVNLVEKSIVRVEKLQKKFDSAFMTLDMMQCDGAIKTQDKMELNTIYFFMQGTVAAANSCSVVTAARMYDLANRMLDKFLSGQCGYSGNNYIVNFQ